jgi:predicted component of type VI protein secretion system
MLLVLTVRSGGATAAPVPALRIEGRGAVIGRAAECDWVLADPSCRVSARHCEVHHRNGAYALVDTSTNGTFVDGVRMTAPHFIRGGETLAIGDYRIAIELGGAPSPQAISLDDWTTPRARSAPFQAAPAGIPQDTAMQRLLEGLDMLVATRARQRQELGVRTRDTVPPLARAGEAPAPQTIQATIDAIEQHHVAVVAGMQRAFAETLARLSPSALAVQAPTGGSGEERDAALWRAYVQAYGKDGGFVERFATAFRDIYEQIATKA